MSPVLGEPERDPRLADALSRLEDRQLEDGDALRRRIMDAARPMLVALRAPAPPWWAWLSAWVRVAVPVSVAACLAAALLLPGRADVVGGETSSATIGADTTIVLAAFSEPGAGGQLTAHLIAPEAGDWLLAQAFDQ